MRNTKMKKNKQMWLAGVTVLGLSATGCQPSAPEAKQVADTTASRSADMVRGMSAGLRMIRDMPVINKLGETTSLFTGGFAAIPLPFSPGACADGQPCEGVGFEMPQALDEAEADEQAERLAKYLSERIFTTDNVEQTEGNSTVFLLTGSDVCTDGSVPPSPKCVEAVDHAQLRVRTSRHEDDSLSLAVLIGPERVNPLTLKFERNGMELVTALRDARAALVHIDPKAAEALPSVMLGSVKLAMAQHGEAHWSISTSIMEDLRLEWASATGTHLFTSARAAPLAVLNVDGEAKRASFAMALGTTEYRGPYMGLSPSLHGKDWAVSLSGLSFEFDSKQNDAQNFVIAHVGLGQAQSYVSLGDDKLVTLDLNSLSGRHFDLNLSIGEDGLPLVRVQPEFDLVTRFFLSPLKADSNTQVPAAYEDTTYRMRLSGGDAPSVRPVRANTTTGFPGGMQVVTGELSLSVGTSTLSVPAGQCLVSRANAPEGSDSLLGYFEARDCQ